MTTYTILIKHPDWTQERARRVDKAIMRREEADFRCFLLLREVECWIGVPPLGGEDGSADRQEVADLKTRVREALNQRGQAHEDFLRAFVERRVEGVPAWFRNCCHSAAQGGGQSYFRAGYELVRHLRELLEDDQDTHAKLEELSNLTLPTIPGTDQIDRVLRQDEAVWAWLCRELPACMKLVPICRKKRFVAGVFAAVDDDVVP